MDHDPLYSPPLASSGVVDVSAAGSDGQGAAGISIADNDSGDEGAIAHGQWECIDTAEQDGDGWSTPGWFARHRITGETRTINHSRFNFHMTEARFHWLAENNFPASPGRGPWTDSAIDAAMEDGA